MSIKGRGTKNTGGINFVESQDLSNIESKVIKTLENDSTSRLITKRSNRLKAYAFDNKKFPIKPKIQDL